MKKEDLEQIETLQFVSVAAFHRVLEKVEYPANTIEFDISLEADKGTEVSMSNARRLVITGYPQPWREEFIDQLMDEFHALVGNFEFGTGRMIIRNKGISLIFEALN